MRAPIKLNRAGWPSFAGRWPLMVADPRVLTDPVVGREAFSEAASLLKFGTTFKSTETGRHARTDALLAELCRGRAPVFLDIGASDGTTSLELIRVLGGGFREFHVTDLNITCEVGFDARRRMIVQDPGGGRLLSASSRIVAWADTEGALPLLGAWARRRTEAAVEEWTELALVQRELRVLASRDGRIHIRRYDIFEPWSGPAPDVIKIANLLNPGYFTAEQISAALALQCRQLAEDGVLVLVDNRAEEQSSLFRRAGDRMEPVGRVGPGSDVAGMVSAPGSVRA